MFNNYQGKRTAPKDNDKSAQAEEYRKYSDKFVVDYNSKNLKWFDVKPKKEP